MTRWIFHPEIGTRAPQVIDWIHDYLSPYDLGSLDRFRVALGKERPREESWHGVHGYCEYLRRRGKRKLDFRIYCEVTGPYPFTLHADRTRIRDMGEAIAWIVGHEVFHFLCDSDQARGRNSEPEANAAGKAAVKHYRAFLAQAQVPGPKTAKKTTKKTTDIGQRSG